MISNCSADDRAYRGERNVDVTEFARNSDSPRKLLSFMLIAHVDECGDRAKSVCSLRMRSRRGVEKLCAQQWIARKKSGENNWLGCD